jgi:SAM-dependent methyltransferase
MERPDLPRGAGVAAVSGHHPSSAADDPHAGPGGPPPSPAADDPRAFYEAGYTLADRAQAERLGRWRALGARSKADHAVALCARAGLRPRTLVEIGCGDGSLLAELSSRGLAAVLDGFELSGPAAEIARARSIPGARRIEAYDGARVPADDDAYELAVLSHVVEHLPEPAPLLREAARLAPRVLVEVPLEANRSAARPAKRAEAARIGHLQVFDRAALLALLREAGLEPVAELSDPLPYVHHAFFADSPAARARAAVKATVRRLAWRAAPRAVERLFTVHYACLARRVG